MTGSPTTDLQSRCDLLRSLQRRGGPLLLPNAWDVATARAVVAAGFPVVATTSGGVAATLGYEDHEGAPADEMLAAAARIARGVEVPVTVDAEAGYGMEPDQLVAALWSAGAAGCNLEDTDHAAASLGEGRAAPLHLRSPRPRECHTTAASAFTRRAGRAGRSPGQLGNPSVPRRDGALRGPARRASGVRTWPEACDECTRPLARSRELRRVLPRL